MALAAVVFSWLTLCGVALAGRGVSGGVWLTIAAAGFGVFAGCAGTAVVMGLATAAIAGLP